ncbi:MAG: hypothetical protein ACI8YQ_004942 [Polaribacter sp.]|jgi:hypothetical protein
MNVLSETVEMLKQFKDFSLFSDLGGVIQRLEDKVYTEKTKSAAIVLKVDRTNASYVLTKPFHASQEVLEKLLGGSVTIQLRIYQNLDFERLVLGFGDGRGR